MAWTLIAHAANANAATAAINTTGADLIILVTVTFGAQTPTDSQTNTWTGLTDRVGTGGNQPHTKIWYCSNPSTSSTHTFNTSSFYSLEVLAWSGSLTSGSPADVENGAGSGGVSSLATGSITPSQDNCLVISGFGVDTSTTGHTWSVDSSMTISDQVASGANGTNFGSGAAYITQTTATAINATWSISGGTSSSGLSAAIASFKAAAGGGGGGPTTTGTLLLPGNLMGQMARLSGYMQ